jgi:rhodanese-related sulfurtransferase
MKPSHVLQSGFGNMHYEFSGISELSAQSPGGDILLLKKHCVIAEVVMAKHKRVTAQEAREKVKSSDALLVCAFMEDEKFRKMQLEDATSYSEFKKKVASIPKDKEIIFYCDSSHEEQSERLAEEYHDKGYERVRILGDGLKAWRKAGYRVEGEDS